MCKTHEADVQRWMNETFVMEASIPNPFVTEVFMDTEPIAQAAVRKGLQAGQSMSLNSGWNFLLREHRDACLREVKSTRPQLLVLACPCGPWSALPVPHWGRCTLAEWSL